jgi:hypothetical protein
MYTIYHVYGVKIGCTKNYPDRCLGQGFEDGSFGIEDLVSDDCGKKFAGDVEKFWQKYYGYRVDRGHYLYLDEMGRRSGELGTTGFQSGEAGKVGGRRSSEEQIRSGTHISQLGLTGLQTGVAQRIAGRKEHTCPYCGKIGRGNVMFRHHFDNCLSRGN